MATKHTAPPPPLHASHLPVAPDDSPEPGPQWKSKGGSSSSIGSSRQASPVSLLALLTLLSHKLKP